MKRADNSSPQNVLSQRTGEIPVIRRAEPRTCDPVFLIDSLDRFCAAVPIWLPRKRRCAQTLSVGAYVDPTLRCRFGQGPTRRRVDSESKE